MNNKTKVMAVNGLIAALYAVLTYTISAVSFGPIQFRVTEVMVLLGWINPSYIPGLVLGCFLANVASPFGVIDMIFGTLATFLALMMMKRTKNLFVASLWPTLSCIIIGAEIAIMTQNLLSFALISAEIMISEFVVVTVIGVPLVKLLQKTSFYRIITSTTN